MRRSCAVAGVRGRRIVSGPAPHARRALAACAWAHHLHRRRRRAALSGRGCGLDQRRHCRPAADRFPRRPGRGARRPTASRCWRADRVRYVGEPVAVVFADDPYRRRGRRRACRRSISKNCRRSCRPTTSPASSSRASDRADDHREELRRHRRSVPRRPRRRRARRLSIGRHSGVPLETRGAIARYDAARDMLELHGAAKVPHRNREQIAQASRAAPPTSRASVRRPCRRRLRRARRALSRGCAGLCRARMRLGRPVKWIEDRHEHFIATNHSRQQRHKMRAAVDCRRPHPRHRRRVLPRPGRLCAHARRPRRRPHRRHAAGPLSHARPIECAGHYRLTNKTPAATYRVARPLREHVRARAPDRRHRRASSASTASRCAGAT